MKQQLNWPIIMAFDTGYDDVITKNDIGILTEYSGVGITDAIKGLKARKDEWRCMGERAINVYSNNFSWNIMKERIGQLYRTLSVKK